MRLAEPFPAATTSRDCRAKALPPSCRVELAGSLRAPRRHRVTRLLFAEAVSDRGVAARSPICGFHSRDIPWHVGRDIPGRRSLPTQWCLSCFPYCVGYSTCGSAANSGEARRRGEDATASGSSCIPRSRSPWAGAIGLGVPRERGNNAQDWPKNECPSGGQMQAVVEWSYDAEICVWSRANEGEKATIY